MKNTVFAVALCAVSLVGTAVAAEAKGTVIRAWRGETVTASLQPGETVSKAGDLEVKVGVRRPVKYTLSPKWIDYSNAYDRVEWGGTGDGPRVVSVSVPVKTRPGKYRLGDVELEVVDRVLPPASEWKYWLDLWQHPWAVARYFDVEPFSKEHYAKMEPLWRRLAAAGQKTLTASILDLPWNHQCYDGYYTMIRHRKGRDGKWTFDYSVFDEYVAFGKRCGIGPYVSCYSMCPWNNVAYYEDDKGNPHASGTARPGTPFFDEYWRAFLVDFVAHLREKGWFETTYIAMDERSPEDVRLIADFIQKHAPGMKISMAGNRKPSDFKGIAIDNYSQALQFVNRDFLSEVDARRDDGKVTTFYVCCGPGRPNTFLLSRPAEAFWNGFYPAACGLDGFLRWAYNSWPANPIVCGNYGGWAAGDTYLIYPDGSPSIRFLELERGIVAAEKFRILKEQGKRKAELDALAKRFDPGRAMSRDGEDFERLEADTLAVVNAQ